MVRIYLPYVSSLLASLADVSNIKPGLKSDNLYTLFVARQALEQFLYNSIWKDSLRVCLHPGADLANALRTMTDDADDDQLHPWQVAILQTSVSSFKTVLEAEFQTSSVYLVTPRRGYDIRTLLENVEVIFPAELMAKIPDAELNLKEAGKCIAFDLGTAAGFHLCRALETVIIAYWHVAMNSKPLPNNRNLGQYISQMEAASAGDAKTLAALRQIKDHHRNDLMHPEDRLDLDQAIALVGIVQSAIAAMLPSIPSKPALVTTP